MQLKVKKYLYDVQMSIDSIEEFLLGISNYKMYAENKLVRRAVEREIEINGEAINNITKIDSTIKISNARRIVDTRNWVIHAYDSVDNVIVWEIVKKHIPLLKQEVNELLSR